VSSLLAKLGVASRHAATAVWQHRLDAENVGGSP
jgi:hypothetical protein